MQQKNDSMAKAKKMAGASDYIIPMAVVGLGVFALYKLGILGGGSGGGGLATVLSPSSSPPATQQATIITDDTITTFYNGQPTATNPFQVDLYNSDPTAATITQAQATTLWAGVLSAYNGAGFLSWFKAEPDMSPVLQEFQIIAQNGVDVSFVSTVCMADKGVDLGTFMFNGFANDQTGTSGITNIQMLSNFVYWAFSLPTD
jgi:hypothetical protein